MTDINAILPVAIQGILLAGLVFGAYVIVKRIGKKKALSKAFETPVPAAPGPSPKGMSDAPLPASVPFAASKKWFLFPGYQKVELTRIREVVTQGGSFEKRRVITGAYLVNKKSKIFLVKTGIPNMEWGAFYLDPSKLNSQGKIVYDENSCEAYEAGGEAPKWSFVVAQLMANSFVGAAVEVATLITGFRFGKPQMYVFLISAALFGFVIFTVAPIFGIYPSIAVHWLPSAPVVK